MSQANLYGYGRLAWNPDLSVKEITDEWTKQTFGSNPKVVDTISAMQLSSWRTYENYTGPLGLQIGPLRHACDSASSPMPTPESRRALTTQAQSDVICW